MVDGVYTLELANPDGQLLYAGSVRLTNGHIVGRHLGHRYSGTYEVDEQGAFRARLAVSRPETEGEKILASFDANETELDFILVGRVEGHDIRGQVVRKDSPYTMVAFSMTRRH